MTINNKTFNLIFSLFTLILLGILFYGDARHDYALYILTWKAFLNGDSYIPYNTYGPLHLVLSYLFQLHYLLPKIIFGIFFLYLNYFLFKNILDKNEKELVLYFFLTIPCNFLIISIVFFYGIIDSIVSFFVIFSIIFKLKKNYYLSSLFLVIATLIKIYPILFLPFLILEKDRINIKILITSILTIIFSLSIFSIFYGINTIFEPFIFGGSREAKFASIIASLKIDLSNNYIILILEKYNFFVVVVSLFSIFLYCYFKKINWLISIILSYLIILITYKVGHLQFYLGLVVISGFLLSLDKKYLEVYKILFPLILLLSLCQLGYSLTGGYDLSNNSTFPWSVVRDKVGYIFFLVNTVTFFRILSISYKL